jgi:hypothetical protein
VVSANVSAEYGRAMASRALPHRGPPDISDTPNPLSSERRGESPFSRNRPSPLVVSRE